MNLEVFEFTMSLQNKYILAPPNKVSKITFQIDVVRAHLKTQRTHFGIIVLQRLRNQ
jgi:hypothetical protein